MPAVIVKCQIKFRLPETVPEISLQPDKKTGTQNKLNNQGENHQCRCRGIAISAEPFSVFGYTVPDSGLRNFRKSARSAFCFSGGS